MQHGGEPRGNWHGRGHRTDRQHALRLPRHTVEVLLQQLLLPQHALRTDQHACALRREARKRPTTVDNRGSKLFFQCPQRVGQGRLGDVASQRSPTKVLVLVQGRQVAQGGKQVHGSAINVANKSNSC